MNKADLWIQLSSYKVSNGWEEEYLINALREPVITSEVIRYI